MLIGIFNPMGAQSDRLRCEVCQNLILSPINTGFLRYAVATVLTVYGIETTLRPLLHIYVTLQQYLLSFMVLKSSICNYTHILFTLVAIVLTVYSIETAFRSR